MRTIEEIKEALKEANTDLEILHDAWSQRDRQRDKLIRELAGAIRKKAEEADGQIP